MSEYDIYSYGRMIRDGLRMRAYAEALGRTVRPGAVVADLGTGTGVFALLACRLGARRVFAIEPSDVIHVAREIAAANGFGDRIEFLQDLSTNVTLPEPADVIVSDMRGMLPLYGKHLVAIADARRRLLAPDGVLIPARDFLRVAIAEAPEIYDTHARPWEANDYGLDMRAGRPLAINMWRKHERPPHRLLVEPRTWATLDYCRLDGTDAAGGAQWTIEQPGTAHGLFLWFDAEIVDGVGYTNEPGREELVYGSAFFPWTEPVSLARGDVVTVRLSANLVGDDGKYIWRWDATVHDAVEPTRVKAAFRQSTFEAEVLFPARLRKRAETHVPSLTEAGQIDRAILGLMDGTVTLVDVAREVKDRFPASFATAQEALTRVCYLSERYSL